MLALFTFVAVITANCHVYAKIDTSFSRVSREKNGDTVGDIFVNLPSQSYYKIQFRFRGNEEDQNAPSTNEINYYTSGEKQGSYPNIARKPLPVVASPPSGVEVQQPEVLRKAEKVSSSPERRYSYKVISEKSESLPAEPVYSPTYPVSQPAEPVYSPTYPPLTTPPSDEEDELVYTSSSTTTLAPVYAPSSAATPLPPVYTSPTPAPVFVEDKTPVAEAQNKYQVFSYRPQNSRYQEIEASAPKILRFTYRKLDRNGKEIKDNNKKEVTTEAAAELISPLESFEEDNFAHNNINDNLVDNSNQQKTIRKYTFRVINPAEKTSDNSNLLLGRIKTLPPVGPIPVSPAPYEVSPRYPSIVPAYSTLGPVYSNIQSYTTAAPFFYAPSASPSTILPPVSPQYKEVTEEENEIEEVEEAFADEALPRGPKSVDEPALFIDLTNEADNNNENNARRLKRRNRPVKRRFRQGVRRPRTGIYGARSWSSFNNNVVF